MRGRSPNVNVFDVLRDHVAALQKDGHRTVIAGYTAGSLERLTHLLRDHGIDRQHALPRWSDLPA